MTGTEKILKHIEDETQAQTAALLQEARAREAEILSAAEKEAAQIINEGQKKAELQEKEEAQRLETALAARHRRALLRVRGELVQESLDLAYERLKDLPREEYFAFLYQQLEKQAGPGEGVLQLNDRDLDRLPGDFVEKIRALAAKKGGSLMLSHDPADIDGGFLLSYGGILENGSLRAIFEARADELKDAVCAVLFAQEQDAP